MSESRTDLRVRSLRLPPKVSSRQVVWEVSPAEIGPFETALNHRGMAQVSTEQVRLSQVALKERGRTQISTAQIGPDEATPPKSGMTEVPSTQIVLIQDGVIEEDFSEVSPEARGLFAPPCIPGWSPLLE